VSGLNTALKEKRRGNSPVKISSESSGLVLKLVLAPVNMCLSKSDGVEFIENQ